MAPTNSFILCRPCWTPAAQLTDQCFGVNMPWKGATRDSGIETNVSPLCLRGSSGCEQQLQSLLSRQPLKGEYTTVPCQCLSAELSELTGLPKLAETGTAPFTTQSQNSNTQLQVPSQDSPSDCHLYGSTAQVSCSAESPPLLR